MLGWIIATRSWPVLVRIGLATIAVAATTALQLPADIEMPGEPFLLYFVAVIASASLLGRTAGFVAMAETTIVSVLYFEPPYSFNLTYAIQLLAIYAVLAALSVEAFCRLVDSAFLTRTLAESEARFRATFENAAVGIAHLTSDLRWLRANEALCRMLGYPIDELVTKSLQDLTFPDDLAADLAQVEKMRNGTIDNYAMDKRYLRRDGTIVWGRLTVGCVRNSDGSIDYFVAVVEDISARKAHEEQVHFLMREVSHRAKNMLSLVQAIARQTTAHEREDFIERFNERLQALAANQDMLVRNEWQGVDVGDLVRGQLAHLADLVGSRIAMDGPKLRLNATAAQAIGLALHELATNAGKYGALSVDVGHVDVNWRLDGDIFAMNWIERGGPPVSAPQRRGFGTTVIDSMAKKTVGGDVSLDYAPSGVVWRLTCPPVNALE